ncbi:hypothetical protein ABENE_19665 [Asticcacaulis benevestitus DSM 16100 = ATCC BAA-896]|uniref:Uncharacterized protein n=1 Tax=Asticcacaulis benevestitus DSM 16100 = ATCC BAA-896 TaxID=1121022 RepID=V4QYL5_9CAUL|nr:hypothetical protein ABENE_19665 [Asticcacaulis benevestitus DSM 16100 = ATCC BAA-896]
MADGMRIAAGAAVQPVSVKIYRVHINAMPAERMDVAVALASPVDTVNAELEGGLRRLHQLVFLNARKTS